MIDPILIAAQKGWEIPSYLADGSIDGRQLRGLLRYQI